MAASKPVPVKILVSGDVNGSFDKLFARVAKLNSSHGPFEALFCVGSNFFGQNGVAELGPYIRKEKTVPIPTYFIAGNEAKGQTELIDKLPKGGRVCENLTYLGRSGAEFIGGLAVSYISGVYDAFHYKQTPSPLRNIQYENHYTTQDVKNLINVSKKGVDLLLTAEWGRGFHTFASAEILPANLSNPAALGSPVVSEICVDVPCRYHFAGNEDVYLALPPYKNNVHVTRFFGLAKANTTTKQKSLYACSVVPFALMDVADKNALPADMTPCPYEGGSLGPSKPVSSSSSSSSASGAGVDVGDEKDEPALKKQRQVLDQSRFSGTFLDQSEPEMSRWDLAAGPEKKPPPKSYVCRICEQSGHWIQDCPEKKPPTNQRKREREAGGPPADYVCKKCGVAGHWIQQCPNAQEQQKPKGAPRQPLQSSECWFCLSSASLAQHLIISVGNHMYLAAPKGGLTTEHLLLLPISHVTCSTHFDEEAQAETAKFKSALSRYYQSKEQAMITYERHIPTRQAQHMQIQVVPLLQNLAESAEDFIRREGKEIGIDFKKITPEVDLKEVMGNDPFLVFDLPDGSRLLHMVTDPRKKGLFDFPRAVLAKLIGTPERADWKRCQLSQQEEENLVETFKTNFAEYDFTLDL